MSDVTGTTKEATIPTRLCLAEKRLKNAVDGLQRLKCELDGSSMPDGESQPGNERTDGVQFHEVYPAIIDRMSENTGNIIGLTNQIIKILI